jgi:hypothetical protein
MGRYWIIFVLALLSISQVSAASVYLNDNPTISINESDPHFIGWNYNWNNLTNIPGYVRNYSYDIDGVNQTAINKVSPGNCPSGEFVVNATTSGVQCLPVTTDLSNYWGEKISGYLSNVTRISFNQTAGYSGTVGDLYWDSADKTLALKGEDWTLQIGQEIYSIIYNDKGYTIQNGRAVTQDGTNGIYPTAAYADSSDISTGIVVGVSTQSIAPGQTGMVTILGIVHDVNTSLWTPGTTLYVVSGGATGELTDVKPTCPSCYPMTVGQVIEQGETGSMFIRPRTAEIDPYWTADKVYYYNTTYIDSAIYGVLKNTSLTNDYVPITSNGTLIDSPINRIITDEDNVLIYNGTLYLDKTNNMVGVNIPSGTETHNQAFVVQSVLEQGLGTITSVDGVFSISSPQKESFVDGSTIFIGSDEYFITSVNASYTGGTLINIVNFSTNTWTWQQAPFIDVNGQNAVSRGYTWSQDGMWQWALATLSPSLNPTYNDSNYLCFLNDVFDNVMCMQKDGTTTVYGELIATGLNIGNATLSVEGVVAPLINSTLIYLNGTDLQSILDGKLTSADLTNYYTNSQVYNKTESDSRYLQNYTETDPVFNASNATIWAAINSKITGTGTNNTLAMWTSNQTLGDSPIKRIITDEDRLEFYDGDLYIDDTNGMVGVNIIDGIPQSYAQAFVVQSKVQLGIGNITIIGADYDGFSTGVSASDPLPEYFVDAGTIFVTETNMTVYVYDKTNSTYFRIRGTVGPVNYTSTNWTWMRAPYIDVNGPSNSERGYTISSDGVWQWAMMSPDNTNNTEFCLQNRNAWFGGQNYAYCADSTGALTIYGDLTADSANFPRYTGIVDDAAIVTQGATGVANVPANQVNCWDGSTYEDGYLRRLSVPAANLSMTSGMDVVNYIYVECGSSPVFQVTTDKALIDNFEKVLFAKVLYRTGNPLHIEMEIIYGTGKPARIYNRIVDTQEFALSEDTDIVLGNVGTNITLGGIRVWAGITPYDLPSTSNLTRKFEIFRNSDATWNYTTTAASTSFNNTHFDNGTGMQAFTTGYFGIINVYRGIEEQDHIYYINEPNEYLNRALAEADTTLQEPPLMVRAHAVYVGRVIFQESNVSAIYPVSYVPGTAFTASSPIQTHNQLDGLQGGGGGNFYHLELPISSYDYVNSTRLATKASPGNCPSGQVVMNTTTSGVQCVAVATTGDGTGGWVNDSTQTRANLSANITGNIYLGNASTGSVIANKELIMGQVGDVYGSTYLILRNRLSENGAIYYNSDPTNQLIDFIFKTNSTQRNIRLENRTGYSLISNPEFHIGGLTPDTPSLVVGDTSSAFSGKLVIGSYNGSTGLTIRNTSATNMDLYFPVGNFTITDGSDPVVTFTQDDNAIFKNNVTAGLFRGRVENYLNTTEITALGYLNGTGVVVAVGNFSAANSTLARIGNCPSGQFVVNTTTGGVWCAAAVATITSYYANLYNDTAGATITMTTQSAWYNVTGFTLGENNGFTYDATTGKITVNQSGFYQISFFMTGSVNSNDQVEFQLVVNGTADPRSFISHRLANGVLLTTGTVYFDSINAGEYYNLQIRDTQRNGGVYTYNNRVINFVRITS